ncbi:peroxidase [Acidihalobacter aeolianus]|uniref:Peroxidase n=1 Tax=Acidihalobacter aeolianus TaxID=2792603 RepID=A0A1D8K652_9GAMM|nr:Dyp-type peroxidase [Acidihalobacter aeolianus]AOV16437.1 peroxidase [Acidihalobacter aeolianus]
MFPEQPGILAPLPKFARHIFFDLEDIGHAREALSRLATATDGSEIVVGIGASLAAALKADIPGLKTFPALAGPGIEVPSTPAALWCWLRDGEPGELFHRGREIESLLEPAFVPMQSVSLFRHGDGLDLTGYEDGTENPKGEEARATAIVTDPADPMIGSSYVAVQQWLHDFDGFDALPDAPRDDVIGRRRDDNEELEHAPASAHVKRTAQESFEPPAFMFRRSMPWTEGDDGGLMFVAFGHSFYAFETALRRMTGLDDGIADALFGYSRPLTGAYFWCPPTHAGQLDLSALGL